MTDVQYMWAAILAPQFRELGKSGNLFIKSLWTSSEMLFWGTTRVMRSTSPFQPKVGWSRYYFSNYSFSVIVRRFHYFIQNAPYCSTCLSFSRHFRNVCINSVHQLAHSFTKVESLTWVCMVITDVRRDQSSLRFSGVNWKYQIDPTCPPERFFCYIWLFKWGFSTLIQKPVWIAHQRSW